MPKYFLILIFSLLFGSIQGQIVTKMNELKNKIVLAEKEEKLILLDSLGKLIEGKEELAYEQIARQTIALAIELDSIEIAAEHTMMLILFLTDRTERADAGRKLFEDFKDNMIHIKDSSLLTELYMRGASSYFHSGEAEKSLEWYDKAKVLAASSKDSSKYGKTLIYKAYTMAELGQFANASIEYQKSLEFLDIKKDTMKVLTAKLGLSVLYAKNKFYKESFQEVELVKEVSIKSNNYPVYIMALGIIADNNYQLEKYKTALISLKEAISLSELYPQYSTGITSHYKNLAKIYSKLDSFELANEVVDIIGSNLSNHSDNLIKRNFLEAKINLYFAEGNYLAAERNARELLKLQENRTTFEDILSTLKILYLSNQAIGNLDSELYYFKKYTKINDSINSLLKTNALSYYQTLYETKKRDIQIANKNTEIQLINTKTKVQFQWMLLVTVSLLSIGAYFYFVSKRNKAKIELEKNKKALAEQKIKSTRLENDLLNKEIEFKKKDLINLAIEINQNRTWAKILYDKFEKVEKSSLEDKELKLELLGKEIRSKLVVDFESKAFYENIEKLSTQFYDKLYAKAPNLTKNEIKLCSLIRLKISPKEIAILQNITHSSVITSRYRLRKKLQLDSNENLDTVIMDI